MKIALQTFTIRKAANKDLGSALSKTIDIGITAIEYAYAPFSLENLGILRRFQDDFGLEVCALQVQFDTLKNESRKIIDFAKALNCPAIDFAAMPKNVRKFGEFKMTGFCREVNENAKVYLDSGLAYNYHHHDFEFAINGGYMQFSTLESGLDRAIGFTVDTYWATKAGLFVPSLIKKLDGRVHGLHLRDYAQITKWTTKREGIDFAVGKGLIDFEEVFKVAAECNVHYGAIEQDTKTPFEDVKYSLDYIKDHKTDGIIC